MIAFASSLSLAIGAASATLPISSLPAQLPGPVAFAAAAPAVCPLQEPGDPDRRMEREPGQDRVGVMASTSPLAAWLARLGVGLEPPLEAGSALHEVPADAGALGEPTGSVFPICNVADSVSATESLSRPSSAYNPSRGEYLVAWHAVTRAARTNVYGRFVSSSGTPLGEAFAIAETATTEMAPSVAYDEGTNQYWVVWTDIGTGGSGDVRIRRLSATGVPVGTVVTANGPGPVAFAARVACGASRCIVAWNSDPGDGNAHILARSYDANANPVTTVLLLSNAVGLATEPDIAFNPDGANFLVVWYELHDATGWDVVSHGISPDIYSYGQRSLSSASGDQEVPRVAYSQGAGRYLVVWYDGRSQQTWDVYGQLVGSDCLLVGGNFSVYSGAYTDAFPAVAGNNGSSQFLVAYQRDVSGAAQFQIYASVVSGSGGVGSSFAVREWYNARSWPHVTHRPGSSDYLVSFVDDGMSTQPDIQARIARGDGSLAGSPVIVSRGRKGQEVPRLAYASGKREYLVTWADYRSGSDYDLYARRVSAAGNLLGQELVVGSGSALYGYPAVAYSIMADQYLVVWQEVHGPSTGYDIYARRVSGAGTFLGDAFLVSRDTATINEGAPRVVFNPAASEFLVAWHAYTSGQWRIWGQRLSTAGTLIGSNFLISSSSSVTQNPQLAYSYKSGETLAVWQDMRNAGRVDIYGQRLSAAGVAAGGNFAISTAAGDKDGCSVAYGNTSQRFLVVFGDARSGGNDVYGQYVDSAGALVGEAFAIANSPVAETAPAVAYEPRAQKHVAAWWQFAAATDWDVWARTIGVTGGPSDTSATVSAATEVQNWVELAGNEDDGGFLIVWQDFRNGSYDVYGQVWSPQTSATCSLSCSASVPASGTTGGAVAFSASASPSNCTGTVAYDWDFGDGTAHGSGAGVTHTYAVSGSYTWAMTASVSGATCSQTGAITISAGQAQYVVWVPVVSHAGGAGGSQWRSDLGLLNRSASGPASVSLVMHSGAASYIGARSVAAGGQEIVVDVAAQLGQSNGSGALEVRSDRPLLVTSRTYNLLANGWTYGQGNDGVEAAEGLAAGETALIPHLVQNGVPGQVGTSRSNVGLTNTGSANASVTLSLHDANGIPLWTDTRNLGPGEWYQYQEPFRTGAGRNDIAKGYAKVTVNSGAGVVAYGSVLDNASSDATTIVMRR